jgi:hypothetical protein
MSFAHKYDTVSSWMKLLGLVPILNHQQALSRDTIQMGPKLAWEASVKMVKCSLIAPAVAIAVP